METKKPRRLWRVSDELWAKIHPLLPPGKPHPLGCHNPRVENRRAFDAILFVLRTGCQWNALNATGLCSSSSAHRRFQEWVAAGVFSQLWALGLQEYDELKGLEWDWQSMDGAMTKAPLGGKRNRSQPDRPRQTGRQAESADRRRGRADRDRGSGSQPERLQAGPADAVEYPGFAARADGGGAPGALLGQGV